MFELWRQTDLASRTVLGLFIVDADGTGTPHVLAKGDAESAQFSLDGKQVFFLAHRADGGHDLCRINADGTDPVRVCPTVTPTSRVLRFRRRTPRLNCLLYLNGLLQRVRPVWYTG